MLVHTGPMCLTRIMYRMYRMHPPTHVLHYSLSIIHYPLSIIHYRPEKTHNSIYTYTHTYKKGRLLYVLLYIVIQ